MSSNQRLDIRSHSVFDVRDIEPSNRFEVWRESINCIFDVETDMEARGDDFHASLESDIFGSIMIVETKTVAQRWSRKQSHIANDAMDHYMIQLFQDGCMQERPTVGDAELVKTRDNLVVFDLSRPVETSTSDFNNLSLVAPRPVLEDALSLPDDQHMRVLDATSGAPAFLKDMMLSLRRNIRTLPIGEANRITGLVTDLVASSLNTTDGESETDPRYHRISDTLTVRRYIAQNLYQSDLSPKKISEELGISRSKLYQLFDATGGIVTYIRNMRLRRAMLLISDKSKTYRSLYDIALECGYSSDATFIRAFRKAFGIAPGALRNELSLPVSERQFDVQADIDKRYEAWLHGLS